MHQVKGPIFTVIKDGWVGWSVAKAPKAVKDIREGQQLRGRIIHPYAERMSHFLGRELISVRKNS